jgi:hypothetical protein
MKLRALAAVGLFVTSGALAGEGHSHSHSHGGHSHSHGPEKAISEDRVKARSQEEIARLIKKEKLDASWSKAEFLSSEKKTTKGKEEWLVTYKNEASEKKTLFIFLTLGGKFVAANHTGK